MSNGIVVLNRKGNNYILEAFGLDFDSPTQRGAFDDIRTALRAYAKEMSRGFSLSLGHNITEADKTIYDGFKSQLQPTPY